MTSRKTPPYATGKEFFCSPEMADVMVKSVKRHADKLSLATHMATESATKKEKAAGLLRTIRDIDKNLHTFRSLPYAEGNYPNPRNFWANEEELVPPRWALNPMFKADDFRCSGYAYPAAIIKGEGPNSWRANMNTLAFALDAMVLSEATTQRLYDNLITGALTGSSYGSYSATMPNPDVFYYEGAEVSLNIDFYEFSRAVRILTEIASEGTHFRGFTLVDFNREVVTALRCGRVHANFIKVLDKGLTDVYSLAIEHHTASDWLTAALKAAGIYTQRAYWSPAGIDTPVFHHIDGEKLFPSIDDVVDHLVAFYTPLVKEAKERNDPENQPIPKAFFMATPPPMTNGDAIHDPVDEAKLDKPVKPKAKPKVTVAKKSRKAAQEPVETTTTT